MGKEILIKGYVILDQAGKICDNDEIFSFFNQLNRSDVLIAVNKEDTLFLLLPKCKCKNCLRVIEKVKKYAHHEIEKSEVNDLIEELGVSDHK